MKTIISTILFAFLFVNHANAQSLDLIDAAISLTAPQEVQVTFTANATFPSATEINPMNVYFKVAEDDIPADETITLTDNPFGFTAGTSFLFGGFKYYAFQSLTAVPTTTFPEGTPINMGTFAFPNFDEEAIIQLNGGDFGDMGNGSNWIGTAVVQGTDNLLTWPLLDQQTALPVKINRFTATKGENSVTLDWSTSSEINGSHFDVQRSRDLDSWTTIGTVDAVGESSTLQEYQLVDKDLPLSTRSSKTFYYRLNMVDNDGTSELSEVRTVRFDQDGANFIVYPNPSINEVFVNLSSITTETGPATMHVINMAGERVKEVTLSSNDDIRVDVSNITAGVYYFVVRQGEETFTQKVIKID